ncbi:type III secretion system chaperone [Verrucomicrobium sp. BvORR106]|uniref:type III secretion system chaperone n=1 Tax=Verrucomicrobium sp. BvORR106 TaxID=1403819 RepID=UPI00056DE9D0|nr:type III secretion system chaperone [Verrucomicrobium sp. BvORR106]
MDWQELTYALFGNDLGNLPQSSALEVVIGNTTFILEHDEARERFCCLGVISSASRPDSLHPDGMLAVLKANMDLHAAGMGTLSYDRLEGEIVWRKEWHQNNLHPHVVREALQQIDELRGDLNRSLSMSRHSPGPQDSLDLLLSDLSSP